MFHIMVTAILLTILSGFVGIEPTAYACEGCPGETSTDVKIRKFVEYTMFFGIIGFSLLTFYYLLKKRR